MKEASLRMFTFARATRKPNFGLHDLSIAANAGFPAHELGDIVRHLKVHRDTLQAAWHEHFGD
jgi:hypothetical protein